MDGARSIKQVRPDMTWAGVMAGVGVLVGIVMQSVTPAVANDLGVPLRAVTLAASWPPLAHSAGILFWLLLGGEIPRRGFVRGCFAIASCGLLLAAAIPSLAVLYIGPIVAGFAVSGMHLLPAAALAGLPDEHAKRKGELNGRFASAVVFTLLTARLL